MGLTYREVSEQTGWSVSWLKTHTCGWCDQTALQACRGNCSVIYGDPCKPDEVIDRLKALKEKQANDPT